MYKFDNFNSKNKYILNNTVYYIRNIQNNLYFTYNWRNYFGKYFFFFAPIIILDYVLYVYFMIYQKVISK